MAPAPHLHKHTAFITSRLQSRVPAGWFLQSFICDDKTLTDCRSPGLPGKRRALQHTLDLCDYSLIQYSHVQPQSVTPDFQADCMSKACECGGHLQFYTMLSDQSAGLVQGGHRTGCLCAAAHLGHVWTIQHGCQQIIPGVCSHGLMPSQWSPLNLQSIK